MSSLLNGIPGLGRFVSEKSFDYQRAMDLISGALGEVISSHPAGALEWIMENRPDLYSEILRAESLMDKAYQQQDLRAVTLTSREYILTCERAWGIFQGRPPVIERQEDLFCGGRS